MSLTRLRGDFPLPRRLGLGAICGGRCRRALFEGGPDGPAEQERVESIGRHHQEALSTGEHAQAGFDQWTCHHVVEAALPIAGRRGRRMNRSRASSRCRRSPPLRQPRGWSAVCSPAAHRRSLRRRTSPKRRNRSAASANGSGSWRARSGPFAKGWRARGIPSARRSRSSSKG